MLNRVLAGTVSTALVAGALALIPASSASAAAVTTEDFESFTTGSPVQGGWAALDAAAYTAAGFDQQIADTTGLYAGALGTKALRISNAVTSSAFANQLATPSLADEAGETAAENGGMSGGVRQSRFAGSFSFASADPAAEQPGLAVGISPDRGDGARMGLIRLYDTPTGLKVTALGYDSATETFPETTVAENLDRAAAHRLSYVLDLVDGVANDRLVVTVDGTPSVVVTSWEQYFRAEGAQSRTVDSLLIRTSGTAQPALSGKGFYLDAFETSTGSTPAPVTVKRNLDEVGLAAGVEGWTSVVEDWNGATAGTANGATGSFVNGPTGATGTGSYRIDLGAPVDGNNGKLYFGRAMTGVPLAGITGLRYRTHTPTTNNETWQPYVNLTVAGGGKTYSNLVFEPSDPQANPNAASIANGTWNTVDAFAPGAKWRATNTLAGQPLYTYHTLTEWLALAPDLRTHGTLGGVYLVAGASKVTPGWTGYQVDVDQLDITVAGTTTAYGIDNPAPAAVSGLVASHITQTGFDLSWSPTAHATSYDVKIAGVVTSQTGVTKSVTGLEAGTPVPVLVRARNSTAVGEWEVIVVTTTAAAVVVRTSTLSVTPASSVYGSTVVLGGVLTTAGAGTGGQLVTVARRSGSSWITLGTVRTVANGSWRLPVKATFPTSGLRAVASGFPTATGTVTVASKPSVKVSHRTVTTTVSPTLSGHRVFLQKSTAGTWKNVSRTLLKAGSTKSFTVAKKGVYRIVVPATKGFARGTSAAVTVR